ncbi:HNH homing endonuclease [Vibrio phage JSF13]|jgi:hypothetical protein|uniref:HNH homing endonuclease n=1 Tax=Vibrio phage ICP1 TaxID=979525 RepID=F1D1A2_9CAUD|nr:HNH homing endonuclease [Vibrio phage ICP1]ADX88123.1 HNH homing endonuclease [Vibrio phage ICP1_2006_D]ADX88350.1 HNH homing endonuclease [Vibrio phage ICP1_2006_C]ADX88578.1 HNH homing endonuclease [Vibrio phage ICP1_2006_B]ADX88804.1 HNH homing endonuclease [Vibrio phage ICP1_2006_A]ADX89030.1 HNH homing endonuclease [Vibrio phage ICP1_2005_A]ADX89262.1 HNH homing endonuclease [Vibrio phage ICP1_2001_A]ADX89489.1 HNH homing endonuclease [Vibrio phage ICP1_2004_A]APD17832.1 HNH homing 
MENEIFNFYGVESKRIPYLPNYSASKCGRIFRIDTGKEMSRSPNRGNSPYLMFRSCHDNKPRNSFVHVAVAWAWIPNDDPEVKTQVNHKDGNKLNNHVNNLEHVSHSQNQRHAINTGLKGKGEDLYNASMSEDIVHKLCQELQEGLPTKYLAEKYGVSKDIVRKLKAGDTYFHIRVLYNIDHTYKFTLSEESIRWVCEQIVKGLSDRQISNKSSNKNITPIECKRIRYKIRYKSLTDEYF